MLIPPEYNAAYQQHQNLNKLLADLHASVIIELVTNANCREVLVDQFAAPEVLQDAVTGQVEGVNLVQRTKGEEDIAVAAASILARETFIAAIEDYRVKAEMDIPLGSSSPRVIEVGKAILRKWGKRGLERIAKIDFKTTQKILGESSSR
jgi:ribonuclease HIII